MKHPQNSRGAAGLAPPSQPQDPLAAACLPASQQQYPFSARRSPAPTRPAAAQSSPSYVVSRTPAVAIAQFLINGQNIRNQRKCLKTIVSTHF